MLPVVWLQPFAQVKFSFARSFDFVSDGKLLSTAGYDYENLHWSLTSHVDFEARHNIVLTSIGWLTVHVRT